MSSKNGFLDEQGMVDLARKTIEGLRKEGVSPAELRRLENILKEGGVGESLILSGLLRTIRNEISPDASHKKLLQIYEGVEECCAEVLHISAAQADRLKSIRDRTLSQRGKKGPGPFFDWLFQAAEILAGKKKSEY